MIGMFDSGVGGMSVLREIRKILPMEDIIYYADTAHCPYGEKTREYVIERARFITSQLLSKGATIIVVACNTATAAAISSLRKEFPETPFIGMEPAIKPAVMKTETGVVGVLATAGTLKAQKYLDTREQFAEDIKVVERVGQGFVELVEQQILDGQEAEKIVAKSITPMLDENADVIVLGCTHYPFLTDVIRKVASDHRKSDDTLIMDPASAVARHLAKVMKEKGLLQEDSSKVKAETTILSSGDVKFAEDFFKAVIG